MAKTVDAMVNVEPYNAIAEADGIANTLVDFSSFDKLPVFMAATPEFVEKNPDTVVELSQGLARRREGLQEQSEEGRRHDLRLLHVEGLQDVAGHLHARRSAASRSRPGWPDDLEPYMSGAGRRSCSKTKKIKAIPDWNKAFRKDFLKKAMALTKRLRDDNGAGAARAGLSCDVSAME